MLKDKHRIRTRGLISEVLRQATLLFCHHITQCLTHSHPRPLSVGLPFSW